MATVTKTLALKIGQVKYVPATSTPAPRLGSQIIWNLLEDSPMERIKKRVQMIPLHSILKTVKAKSSISPHQARGRHFHQNKCSIDTKHWSNGSGENWFRKQQQQQKKKKTRLGYNQNQIFLNNLISKIKFFLTKPALWVNKTRIRLGVIIKITSF